MNPALVNFQTSSSCYLWGVLHACTGSVYCRGEMVKFKVISTITMQLFPGTQGGELNWWPAQGVPAALTLLHHLQETAYVEAGGDH